MGFCFVSQILIVELVYFIPCQKQKKKTEKKGSRGPRLDQSPWRNTYETVPPLLMARPQTARKIPRSWTKKMSETEAVAREKMGAAAKPVNVRATTRIGNVYCGKS